VLQHDIVDRPPVRGWGRGRVVLLGDAAHPTTPNLGQGAAMAIEDAQVLQRALKRVPVSSDRPLRERAGTRQATALGACVSDGRLGRVIVRAATAQDAAACAAIYAPYVTGTSITFDLEPPTPADFAERIAAAAQAHAWLVVLDDGVVLGYAYAGSYRPRAAYRWSCETSVYLDRGRHGGGAGRVLYQALLDRLAQRGYRTAVAGMTLPNEPSIALHTALGFEPIGTFARVGYKDGAWRDVAWMQRDLGQHPPGSAPQEIT